MADTSFSAVRKISPSGVVSTLVGTNGTVSTSPVPQVWGIAIDPASSGIFASDNRVKIRNID